MYNVEVLRYIIGILATVKLVEEGGVGGLYYEPDQECSILMVKKY